MADQIDIERERRRRKQLGIEEAPVLGVLSMVQSVLATPGEFFTGTGRFAPSEEIAGLPEIGALETGDVGRDLRIAAGLLVTADPKAQIDIIQNVLPEADIRTTDNGETIIKFADQEVVLNRPGFSFQDGIQAVAQILSFVPAARLSQLAGTTIGRISTAGFGEALTSIAQDVAAGTLGSEQGISKSRALLSGLFGGAFQTGGEVFRRISRTDEAFGLVTSRRAVESAEELTDATGIQLTRAQQAGTAEALETQTILTTLPGSTQRATEALSRQNVQAAQAVDDFILTIGRTEALETGAIRFRTAAENAVDAQRQIRSQETSPIFENAFNVHREAGVPIDLAGVLSEITRRRGNFPTGGQIDNTLKRVEGLITNAGGDLRLLQGVKKEIDLLLERRGSAALGNTTKRELRQIIRGSTEVSPSGQVVQRPGLIPTMEAASPEFALARQEFIRLSPAVDALENGILGRVARIDDVNLRNISGQIFNAAETNPAILRNVKNTINEIDPGAFDELLRVELQRRLGRVRLPDDASVAVNMPNLLRRGIFGNNDTQRDLIFAALDGQRLTNARFLEEILTKASKGRFTGSPTAMRAEQIEAIRRRGSGGLVVMMRDILSLNRERILQGTAQELLEVNADKLSRIIFDTSFTGDVSRIRRLMDAGQDAEAGRALNELFARLPAFVSREVTTEQRAVQ